MFLGAVVGLVTFVIFVLLMVISLCFRFIASGLRITNNVLDRGRDPLEQSNLGRDSINLLASLLRRTGKLFAWLARLVAGFGGIATVVMGLLTMVLIAVVAVYSVVLNEDLANAVVNRQEDAKDDCVTPSVGGYWEELDTCMTKEAVFKPYTWASQDPATKDSADETFITPGSDVDNILSQAEPDDYGFWRVKDTDLNVDFYCIAWSRAIFTECGQKYRMTMENDDGSIHTIYVILTDERQARHSKPDSQNKSPICYPSSGAPASAEFYLHRPTTLKNHPEEFDGDGFVVMGNVSAIKATDTDHDLKGGPVKIEHYLGKTGTEYASQNTFQTDATVKKEKYSDDSSGNRSDVCEKEKETVDVSGRVLWLGDSRTVGLHNHTKANGQWDDNKDFTCDELAQVSMGLSYFRDTSIPKLKEVIKDDDTVVINYGVNDGLNDTNGAKNVAKEYAELINGLAKEYSKNKFIYVSVNPVDDAKSGVKNSSIELFNSEIKQLLDSKVTYLNTYDKIKNSEYLLKETSEDTMGVHYNTPTDGYFKISGFIYDSVRAGGSSSVTFNGVTINFNTRYYTRANDGIYGTTMGIEQLPQSVAQKFQMSTNTFALGRAWQVNNPNGVCPLPDNYAEYLAKGEQPRQANGDLVKGLFTNRADIPIEHAILSYTTSKGVEKEAFIEYLETQNGYLQISEVSGKSDKYAGYQAKYYFSVNDFLKEKGGTFNAMFQPLGDGK